MNPSHRPPDNTPIAIISVESVTPGVVGVTGSNAYGRTLSASVPYRLSSRDAMTRALLWSWQGQHEADLMRAAALASWDAEEPD